MSSDLFPFCIRLVGYVGQFILQTCVRLADDGRKVIWNFPVSEIAAPGPQRLP